MVKKIVLLALQLLNSGSEWRADALPRASFGEVPSPDGLQVQMLRTFNEMMSLAKYPAENLALDIKSHVFYASGME